MQEDITSPFSLSGRTVLVTGASSGIGAHLARVASRAGARVVLAARRVDRLHQLAETLRQDGGQALAAVSYTHLTLPTN